MKATIRRDASAPDFRLFTIAASGSLTLNNIIVTGGAATEGGGLYNQGTLTLTNSTVTGNTTTQNGGGIYSASMGQIAVSNSIIERNRAQVAGGGIYSAGTNLNVVSSRIQRNVAVGLDSSGGFIASKGGGVYTTTAATISESCIVFNTAREGGGIYTNLPYLVNASNNWWGHFNGPTIVVSSSTFDLGDVVTLGVLGANPAESLSTVPSNVNGCIEYGELIYPKMYEENEIFGRFGDPGRALEVTVRVEQILDRRLEP